MLPERELSKAINTIVALACIGIACAMVVVGYSVVMLVRWLIG